MDDRQSGVTPVPVVFLANPAPPSTGAFLAEWTRLFFSLESSSMPYRQLGAIALALGISLVAAAPLAGQSPDSVSAPHLMATVVVNPHHRASAVENARLKRDLARYDARIMSLQVHLDSLKTYADSLDRDRVYFEAAAAQTRLRRTQIEQRLRALEARTPSSTDAPDSTP